MNVSRSNKEYGTTLYLYFFKSMNNLDKVVKIGKVKTVAVHEQGHKLLFLSEISITDLFPSILPHCVHSPHKTILGRGSEINHGTQQEKELLRIIPFYLFICI